MSSVYSKSLQIFNAKQFKESVSEPANNRIYLTFGRCVPWANDLSPAQANTSGSSLYEVWRNMIGGKQLTGNDIAHAIPRVNWLANTVYNAYDDLMPSSQLYDIQNNKFYIVTSEFKVYKCIANSSGNVSTQMPTAITTTSTVTQSDGYVWKYMYTVSPGDQIKYVTNSYIPVKTLTEDDNSNQWQVQEDATPGSIEAIKISNAGSAVTSNAITLTIRGDGTGANAFAQVNTVSNTISNIVVDNPGLNYTYATVTYSGPGSNVSLRAIISPPGGHGSDPLTELGGSNLVLNPRFRGSESGILTLQNDYRQISLMEDPLDFGTTNVASNAVFSQLTVLTVNGTSVEYQEDETVYQGTSLATSTFSGTVVEWDSSNNKIKLSNTTGTPDTELLVGDTSTAARFVDSITDPDFEPNSGKLLYIDNIKPVERAEDQTEDFKIVLKF